MSEKTLELRLQLKNSIASDIAERVAVHKARIAQLELGQASLLALNAAPAVRPLVMLAHGDSWFDYPLNGNLPIEDTDVIAHLRNMGAVNPIILNMSHYADAT